VLARLALGVAVIAGTACGVSVRQTALNAPPRPLQPKPVDQVEVYTTNRPAQPYRDVSMLQLEEESIYADKSEAEILRRLRAVAANQGCDGIIVLGQSGTVQSGITGEYARTLRGLRATCFAYERTPPRADAPATARDAAPADPSAPDAPSERGI
jgi:hypothetical protein